MSARRGYLLLCVLGAILPLWQFYPFVVSHGLDPYELVSQMSVTPVSRFFATDVIVSSFVLWTLVFVEGRRAGMRQLWLPVVANLAVGVSLGLPLFLYMRERASAGASSARGSARTR